MIRTLIPAAVLIAALAGCSSTTAPKPAASPSVPVIANIPQPNPACTPAADRKLGASDDLSSILFVGWIDGKQQEMLVGQAMMQALNGHKVEYAWYCPPRSQWH